MKRQILILSLFLGGCSLNLPLPSMSANVAYKYDMKGTANGVPFNGVAVIAHAASYDIKLESPIDIDLLTITSCHRDFSADQTDKAHWFKKKRGYEYIYTPAPLIEDQGSCLLRLGQFSASKGRETLGVLDFATTLETIPAENDCDGRVYKSTGVSICQAKVGTYQVLRFQQKVQVANSDPKCQFTTIDGMNWAYLVPAGECVTAFSGVPTTGSVPGPMTFHRHTVIGYTDIPIRAD